MLKKVIEMDTPGPAGLYLGCDQEKIKSVNNTGDEITCMTYNMESFLDQCIEKYTTMTGTTDLKFAKIPFWHGPERKGPAREADPEGTLPDSRTANDWMNKRTSFA